MPNSMCFISASKWGLAEKRTLHPLGNSEVKGIPDPPPVLSPMMVTLGRQRMWLTIQRKFQIFCSPQLKGSFGSIQVNFGEADYTNVIILPVYALDRWQKPGDRTDVPRFVLEQGAGPQNSSRYIHSTDHIRLKNLTLGFTLPGRWVQKALIENARVYFSGSNLLTWAKWKQYDPEVPVNGEVFCEAPPMRTFNFGVEITF
jgi:hypothetical protein